MPSMKTKKLIKLRKEMNKAAADGNLERVEEIKKEIKDLSTRGKGDTKLGSNATTTGSMGKKKSMIG
jgi:hypothetical protein